MPPELKEEWKGASKEESKGALKGDEKGLVGLQTFLVDAVRRPSPLANQSDVAALASQVARGSARLTPLEQIDVYREQFWLRHLASLEEDFPTLVHLLGKEGFADLGRAYVAAHPPRSYSLRDLPDRMTEFLAQTEPWSKDPLLSDCARAEWAFIEAFDAADAPPLDVQKIAALPEEAWPEVRLVFHPSVKRLHLAYPAHDFRALVRDEKEAPRPPPRPSRVVVFRAKDDRVRYLDVDPIPFALLEELASGAPLGVAGERVADAFGAADAVEASIGGWFQAWASYGWIRDLVLPGAAP